MANYKNGGKKKSKMKPPKAILPKPMKPSSLKMGKGEAKALRSASRPIPTSKVGSTEKPKSPPKRKKRKKRLNSSGPAQYAGNKRTPGASGKMYSPSGSL